MDDGIRLLNCGFLMLHMSVLHASNSVCFAIEHTCNMLR
jgi:hypothetical protein